MTAIVEVAVALGLGTTLVGATVGTCFVLYRVSRRYLVDQFGQRQRILFNIAGNPGGLDAQTRGNARRDVIGFLQQQPCDAERGAPVVEHKIVDTRPDRRRFPITEKGPNYEMIFQKAAPEHLDCETIPTGTQLVKTTPALISFAAAHCAFKERTEALLLATFQKTYRHLTDAKLTPSEKTEQAIYATAFGFEPTAAEIVAVNHINSGPVQQKIRLVNNFIRPGAKPELAPFFATEEVTNWWWPFPLRRWIERVGVPITGFFENFWLRMAERRWSTAAEREPLL